MWLAPRVDRACRGTARVTQARPDRLAPLCMHMVKDGCPRGGRTRAAARRLVLLGVAEQCGRRAAQAHQCGKGQVAQPRLAARTQQRVQCGQPLRPRRLQT